jgi:hypothetical protein
MPSMPQNFSTAAEAAASKAGPNGGIEHLTSLLRLIALRTSLTQSNLFNIFALLDHLMSLPMVGARWDMGAPYIYIVFPKLYML